MTTVLAAELLRAAVLQVLTSAGPLLLTALAVGVLISLLQAVTQIQEQSLTFLPKLLSMAVVFLVMLPWLLQGLVGFTVRMLRATAGLAQ